LFLPIDKNCNKVNERSYRKMFLTLVHGRKKIIRRKQSDIFKSNMEIVIVNNVIYSVYFLNGSLFFLKNHLKIIQKQLIVYNRTLYKYKVSSSKNV